MTEIIFHTQVEDAYSHMAKLSIKAIEQAQPLVLLFPDALQLQAMSDYLWALKGFIPHCKWDASEEVKKQTLVFLTDMPDRPHLPTKRLLYYGEKEVDPSFKIFERLVEIITVDPKSVEAGRQKWKKFQQMGYPLQHIAIKK